MLELLGIIKPDSYLRKGIGAKILWELPRQLPIKIASIREYRVPESLCAEHYAHIKGRPFYPWLVEYMMASPVFVLLIQSENNIIPELREFLGDTMAHKAKENTIRGRFGIYGGINCVHISDEEENARKEVGLWRDKAGLEAGKMDINIEEYYQKFKDLPDHTMDLRKIAFEIAEKGTSPERELKIKDLVGKENPNLTHEEREKLVKIIVGGCVG